MNLKAKSKPQETQKKTCGFKNPNNANRTKLYFEHTMWSSASLVAL